MERIANGIDDLLGDERGILAEREVGEEDGELVSSEACDGVALANARLHARRDRLQERFSVVWFVAGLGMLVGAAFPGLLTFVADAMGVRDTNVALFSIVLLFLLGLALNFSVTMSRQAAQITRLAQERALEGARKQAASADNGSEAREGTRR